MDLVHKANLPGKGPSRCPPLGVLFCAILSLVPLLAFTPMIPILIDGSPVPRSQPIQEVNQDLFAFPPSVSKYFTRMNQDDSPYQQNATCGFSAACVAVTDALPELVVHPSQATPEALTACHASGVLIRVAQPTDMALSRRWYLHDLFLGFFPTDYSYQFPHFALLSGMLFDMVEILLGDRWRSAPAHVRFEKSGLDAGGQWTVISSEEPSLDRRRNTIAPAILVEHTVLAPDDDPKLEWIWKFVYRLFSTAIVTPVMFARPSSTELACFRSVWLPDRKLNSKHAIGFINHTFYKDNDWVKSPRQNFCSDKSVRVTLENRGETRALTNVGEIKAAIQRGLAQQFNRVVISEVFLEEMSFDDQVQLMQGTDVLVAAHGAGLTNALFMRQDTYLLEIFPFGYTFLGFQKSLDLLFDMQGDFIVSEPDMEGFKSGVAVECVENCNKHAERFQSLIHKTNMSFVQESLKNFRTYPENVELENSPDGSAGLRGQRLLGDPALIEKYLRSWIQRRCPL